MRVLGLVLAGALALTAPIGAHAGSLGPGWYPMPNGWNGDWRRAPGASRQWNGGPVSPRWWPTDYINVLDADTGEVVRKVYFSNRSHDTLYPLSGLIFQETKAAGSGNYLYLID